MTDQSSILRFVEDNWQTGHIGDGSLDTKAGSLDNLFDFGHHHGHQTDKLILDPATGQPAPAQSEPGVPYQARAFGLVLWGEGAFYAMS